MGSTTEILLLRRKDKRRAGIETGREKSLFICNIILMIDARYVLNIAQQMIVRIIPLEKRYICDTAGIVNSKTTYEPTAPNTYDSNKQTGAIR